MLNLITSSITTVTDLLLITFDLFLQHANDIHWGREADDWLLRGSAVQRHTGGELCGRTTCRTWHIQYTTTLSLQYRDALVGSEEERLTTDCCGGLRYRDILVGNCVDGRPTKHCTQQLCASTVQWHTAGKLCGRTTYRTLYTASVCLQYSDKLVGNCVHGRPVEYGIHTTPL